jgi:hypothetical protein
MSAPDHCHRSDYDERSSHVDESLTLITRLAGSFIAPENLPRSFHKPFITNVAIPQDTTAGSYIAIEI